MRADASGPASALPGVDSVSAPLLHANFEEAEQRLDELIETYSLVFLAGPHSVGKTALAEYLIARYNALVADQPTQVRAAVVQARTKRERTFSYKELWRGGLRALSDPLPDRKFVRPRPSPGSCLTPIPVSVNASEDDLFQLLRESAFARGLRVLFIDEARALVRHRSPHVLESTLNVLRDLTNGLSFTIVLVATGALLEELDSLVDLSLPPEDVRSSPELAGRRSVVYFPHYRADVREEHELYGKAVRTMFDRLPPELRPKLRPAQHRELIDRSTGCVGHTVKWLRNALVRCRRAGDARLCWEHFASTARSDNDRDAARIESDRTLALYEKFSRTIFSAAVQAPVDTPAPAAESGSGAAPSAAPAVKPKRRSGGRIGVPKAKRHRVA